MISNLKNQALQNPDNTYLTDLTTMCDLATYGSSKSKGDIPASGVVSNTTGKSDTRKAGDEGQNKRTILETGKYNTITIIVSKCNINFSFLITIYLSRLCTISGK